MEPAFRQNVIKVNARVSTSDRKLIECEPFHLERGLDDYRHASVWAIVMNPSPVCQILFPGSPSSVLH